MFHFSALTLVKMAVVLLGLFNLTLMFMGRPSKSPSITSPRQIHIKNDPALHLLHLAIPPSAPLTLITEESVHYPINGTLADSEWTSLVPSSNHGLVLLDTGAGGAPRTYAISMFHTLHCLDRIRRAILGHPGPEPEPESGPQSRYHVHHCFNYVRQMVLCAANTRLNPTNHVLESGQLATDGIGLQYQCRDWTKVYETFEAIDALNRTMTFA